MRIRSETGSFLCVRLAAPYPINQCAHATFRIELANTFEHAVHGRIHVYIPAQLVRRASDKSRVSPTVLRIGGYRFYFFSREEPRAHVHVQHATGQAKFWLEPVVELAHNCGHGLGGVSTAQGER